MIKSDVQITETAMNMPQADLRNNLNLNLSSTETKIENPLVEKINDRLNTRNHFTRLKRRMRSRGSSIF